MSLTHIRETSTRTGPMGFGAAKVVLILTLLLSYACGREEPRDGPRPVVFVGVDGAEWSAIEDLWSQGRMPNLRALADRGVSTKLKPNSNDSPVIWTSMVTGVRPGRHGIVDFVLPTVQGDLPVSSTIRRVPAIWNMLSTAERRVAVLGWWVSWPAEAVNGIMVSDRALRLTDQALFPESLWPQFQEIVDRFPLAPDADIPSEIARQDRVLGELGKQLLNENFDLTLIYQRSPDIESHLYWKYFQPPPGDAVDPDKLRRFGERVPAAYDAFDRLLGQLVEAAPADANFFVVSDHGFTNLEGEHYRMQVDLNRVLEHMGYLVRVDGEIDWSNTQAVAWNSTPDAFHKMVRIGLDDREPRGPVSRQDLDRLLTQLAADLKAVVHESGVSLFHVRPPSTKESEQGADLTVVTHKRKKVSEVFFRGEPIPGVIQLVQELTGTHTVRDKGIFVAAGPDIDPSAEIRLVHTLDIAPILLYLLDLPIAEDFDGQLRPNLFTPEFRKAHPVRTVQSWGTRQQGPASTSEVDAELLEQLRALGYID